MGSGTRSTRACGVLGVCAVARSGDALACLAGVTLQGYRCLWPTDDLVSTAFADRIMLGIWHIRWE